MASSKLLLKFLINQAFLTQKPFVVDEAAKRPAKLCCQNYHSNWIFAIFILRCKIFIYIYFYNRFHLCTENITS